jgi:cytoskeletal protein RodZ
LLYNLGIFGGIWMSGFGEQLKIARMSRGLEVREVASILRLQERVIECLESERLSELPERPLALGYTQRYARLLGLDPSTIQNLYPPRNPTIEWKPPRQSPWRWLIGVLRLEIWR